MTHDASPPPLDLPRALCLQARANRLANHRLHAAMQALSTEDLHAPRTSFFPTLMATLNHLLDVDVYYLGCLRREDGVRARVLARVPHELLAPLAAEQVATDGALIAFCDGLTPASVQDEVAMDRGDQGVQRDLAGHVLQHLFMHQTHHRGQVHAMLAGTSVAPPQLDEFLMPSDSPLRVADMRALGWDEIAVYGVPAAPWR